MAIKINKNVNIKSIESRFELTFKRERIDIAKLLAAMKHGQTLEDIFGNNKSVAISIRKLLSDENLIDTSCAVTPTGEDFIRYPYRIENERGIYSASLVTAEFGSEKVTFINKLDRKLSNEEREQETFSTNEIYVNNEFALGDKERGVMVSLNNKSKSYVKSYGTREYSFNISDGTFEDENGTFLMGDAILNIAKNYATKIIDQNAGYFGYNKVKNLITVNNLDDFAEKDLLDGYISSKKIEDIELLKVPFEIEGLEQAIKYAYFYIYNKLINDNYFTAEEMNEVFQNEVLSKNLISDSIKDKMLDFTYTIDGFEKYLSPEKYSKLSYKLKVMKSLLNIEGMKNVDGFTSVQSYPALLKLLNEHVNNNDVKKLYMVMGYAFARNKKNNMVECIRTFKNCYSDIVIVNKSGVGKVNEDDTIKSDIAALGVGTINKPIIDMMFHDRYLIYEL